MLALFIVIGISLSLAGCAQGGNNAACPQYRDAYNGWIDESEAMGETQADNFNTVFVSDFVRHLKSESAEATGSVRKAIQITQVELSVTAVQQRIHPNEGDPMATMAEAAQNVAALCKVAGSPIRIQVFKRGG
jgi:hypothetical protein